MHIAEEDVFSSGGIALSQSYPNPFCLATTIAYQLQSYTGVTLKIYDIKGREIRTLVSGNQYAGNHSVKWDGTNNHGESACISVC